MKKEVRHILDAFLVFLLLVELFLWPINLEFIVKLLASVAIVICAVLMIVLYHLFKKGLE